MTDRAALRQRWIAVHCEQSRSTSCVPACAAMVQGLAQGLDAAEISQLEMDHIARWSPDGRGVCSAESANSGLIINGTSTPRRPRTMPSPTSRTGSATAR